MLILYGGIAQATIHDSGIANVLLINGFIDFAST